MSIHAVATTNCHHDYFQISQPKFPFEQYPEVKLCLNSAYRNRSMVIFVASWKLDALFTAEKEVTFRNGGNVELLTAHRMAMWSISLSKARAVIMWFLMCFCCYSQSGKFSQRSYWSLCSISRRHSRIGNPTYEFCFQNSGVSVAWRATRPLAKNVKERWISIDQWRLEGLPIVRINVSSGQAIEDWTLGIKFFFANFSFANRIFSIRPSNVFYIAFTETMFFVKSRQTTQTVKQARWCNIIRAAIGCFA